jgi:hypothetical protein
MTPCLPVHLQQIQGAHKRRRRNSTSTGEDRQAPKQRAQRTTMACERCRTKKLRCMGGHPCSGCQRAKVECDFGDRAWESQQNSSLTNQRLAQLEKTIAGLVIDISHLTRAQPAGGHIESSARASPSQSRDRHNLRI